jgi:hypothetical protein
MASRESRERKEEIVKLFSEVHKIAALDASPILREALDKYKARFEELTKEKEKTKKEGGE